VYKWRSFKKGVSSAQQISLIVFKGRIFPKGRYEPLQGGRMESLFQGPLLVVPFTPRSLILLEGLQKDALLLGGFFNGKFLTPAHVEGLALMKRVNPPQKLQNCIQFPVINLSRSLNPLRPIEKVRENLFHLLLLLTYYKKNLPSTSL
jgi:hypothetical protein